MCPISTLLPTGSPHSCTWLHGPGTEGTELPTLRDGKFLIQQEEKGPVTPRSKASPGRDVGDRARRQLTVEGGPISLPMAACSCEHAGGGNSSPSSQGPAEASSTGRKSVTSKLGGVKICLVQRTNTL